jgi:uncharacterized protein YgbK (DUF1537 family)
MPATLIADDLTGACDAGALFAGGGRVGVFIDADVGPDWGVAAVDTETRALGPAAARERVRGAAGRLAGRIGTGLLFKKIDSTLRGAVGAELDELLAATGRPGALVCPAFPAQGRTVREGILRVGGLPAHASAIGRDPSFAGDTSEVAAVLRRGAGRPVVALPLARMRGGAEALRRALAAEPGALVVADAESDADLDALAGAALAVPGLVLAGSAGLARAAASRLGLAGPPAPLPEGRAWLVVAGSLHPASRAQLRALEAAGVAGAIVEEGAEPDIRALIARLAEGRPAVLSTREAADAAPQARSRMAACLAAAAARLLARARPDCVAVTGGDTAHALMRALGADHIALRGAPGSGLALGDLVARPGGPVTLLTKAGGFGPPDLFLTLLKGSA